MLHEAIGIIAKHFAWLHHGSIEADHSHTRIQLHDPLLLAGCSAPVHRPQHRGQHQIFESVEIGLQHELHNVLGKQSQFNIQQNSMVRAKQPQP